MPLNLCRYHIKFWTKCNGFLTLIAIGFILCVLLGEMMHAFTLIERQPLPKLSMTASVWRHSLGLLHYHLALDAPKGNTENAFLVGFGTHPNSSMGQAHILEHVVLCGSAHYPVRDPFFGMLKRSLATFMNAFTAADWTAYPFATQNQKDYANLMDVYLDAVFFPTLDVRDFAQEGVRVVETGEGLAYQGIVLNEMKGAMSSQTDQLYHAIAKHLYTHTTYHHNSGGDPKDIIKLTHTDLLEFHATHYHPSNAIVMTYGDVDPQWVQSKLSAQVLTHFDDIRPRITGQVEPRIDAPKRITEPYATDAVKPNSCHHLRAYLLPAITDSKMRLSMRLVEGVLLEHSGSPLRAFLEETPLGAPSSILGLDDGHLEMVFYAGVQAADEGAGDAVFSGIDSLLQRLVQEGIDRKTLDTILHQMELDARHIGGDGGMPYGLSLLLDGFSTALHGGSVRDVWDIEADLAWLKVQIQDPRFVPDLIKTHLLNNQHRVDLTLVPDASLFNVWDTLEKDALTALDASLDDEARAQITKDNEALLVRQNQVDNVDILPKVTLDDVQPDIDWSTGCAKVCEFGTLWQYAQGTGGLCYVQLIKRLDDALIYHPLLGLYIALLGELGTDALDAKAFDAKAASVSSGVTCRISIRADAKDKTNLVAFLVLATRALDTQPKAVDLLQEVCQDAAFTDQARALELLKSRLVSLKTRLNGAGHAFAMQAAGAEFAPLGALEYAYSGLPAIRALDAFLQNADMDALCRALSDIHTRIQSAPMDALLIAPEDRIDVLTNHIQTTLKTPKALADVPLPTRDQYPTLAPFFALEAFAKAPHADQKEAWLIETKVHHNARAYQAVEAAHDDVPALLVLAGYLRNGYLHAKIREQGGAYGAGASYDMSQCAFRFFSYRDPNLCATYDAFDDAIDWMLTATHEPRLLEEAILGVVSSLDKPSSPAGSAVKACFLTLHGRSKTDLLSLKMRVLSVTLTDLIRVTRTYLYQATYQDTSLMGDESGAVNAHFTPISIHPNA